MPVRYAMHSGVLINIKNLKEEDLCLDDIAHHLSIIQRYGGALPINISYSVAEHCVNITNYIICSGKYVHYRADELTVLARGALMHDASEAYLGDMVSPIKQHLPEYKKIENELTELINNKYNCHSCDEIKFLDKNILYDEVNTLMPHKLPIYAAENNISPLHCPIIYNNSPIKTKTMFISYFEALKAR